MDNLPIVSNMCSRKAMRMVGAYPHQEGGLILIFDDIRKNARKEYSGDTFKKRIRFVASDVSIEPHSGGKVG